MYRNTTLTKLVSRGRYGLYAIGLLMFNSLNGQTSPDEALKESINVQESIDRSGEASQVKVDVLADETQDILMEYRTVLRQIENLVIYNDNMQKVVDNQQLEVNSLQEQLDHLEDTKRGIVPLMRKMIEKLDHMVAIDTPFLPKERTKRVQDLKNQMVSSQITTSEKYRLIMSAYQTEMDYGRTIEVYDGDLVSNGSTRKVDFLRFGRIGLYYQTLDQVETGVWNPKTKSWETLGDEYKLPIRNAIRIARKQAAPDLIRIPLPAAEVVK